MADFFEAFSRSFFGFIFSPVAIFFWIGLLVNILGQQIEAIVEISDWRLRTIVHSVPVADQMPDMACKQSLRIAVL
jgi:hypothetical protein